MCSKKIRCVCLLIGHLQRTWCEPARKGTKVSSGHELCLSSKYCSGREEMENEL